MIGNGRQVVRQERGGKCRRRDKQRLAWQTRGEQEKMNVAGNRRKKRGDTGKEREWQTR
jgi:hypothetical protein